MLDDHAFAKRKIATFDNDIQILGAQKHGHLLIIKGAESQLAEVVKCVPPLKAPALKYSNLLTC